MSFFFLYLILIVAALLAALIVAFTLRQNAKDKNRQETLRLLLEHGHKATDPEIISLLNVNRIPTSGSATDTYRGLMVSGIVCIFIGAGIAVMLGIISFMQHDRASLSAALGIGSMMLLMGLGLIVSARFVNRTELVDRD